MFVSTLRGQLPAPSLTFFITGATSRDRAASDQGPGHHTVTYGVVAARRPPMGEPTNNARSATSVALCTTPTCHSGTLQIVRMALLTEPVPRSVRQV